MSRVLPLALLALAAASETAPCADRSGQCPGALDDDVALMQVGLIQSLAQMTSGVRRSEERAFECTGKVVPEVQLGFAMDCTGSTSKYLAALKGTVVSLSSDLKKKVKDLQMAFLCYRDWLDTDPPRFEWAVSPSGSRWFTDSTELQDAMAPFISKGGKDAPEDNAGGMGQFLEETNLAWSSTAHKMLMVISKDRDSKRPPFKTEAEQCQLMKDLKKAGIALILGHMDNNPTTSMLADSPGWRKCYDDEKSQISEVDVTGHVEFADFEETLLHVICDTLDPPTTSVTGDPHVTNLDGERFNLNRVGIHELLRLPRQMTAEEQSEPLLEVLGKVESEEACMEAFVRQLDIRGQWLSELGGLRFAAGGGSADDADAVVLEVNGTRYGVDSLSQQSALDGRFGKLLQVSVPGGSHSKGPDTKIRRSKFLNVKVHLPTATLTVDWVHRKVPGGSEINHLNLVASGLPRHGIDVGGILGHDDHTEATARAEECKLPQSALVSPLAGSRERDQEPQVLMASHEDLQ